MPFWRDGAAHQIKELGSKQRVMLEVVDPKRPLMRDYDVAEARLSQPFGEDTLRHRTRNSASPRLRVDDHLGRQIVFDDDVRHRDASTWTQDPECLEQHAALSG